MHCAHDTRRHMSELIMMKPTVPQRVHPVTSCGPMQCHDLSGGRFGHLAQRHIGDQRKHHLHCMTKARRYVVESAPPDKPCRQHRQKAAGVDSGASVTDSVVCATHSHGRLTTRHDPKNMPWNTSMLGRQHLRYVCTGSDYIAEYVWNSRKYMGAAMMYGMLLFTISRMYTEIHGRRVKNTVFAMKSGQKQSPNPARRHGRHGFFLRPPCLLAFSPRGCTKREPGDMGDI